MRFTKATSLVYGLYVIGIAVYIAAFSLLRDIHSSFFLEYLLREALEVFCRYWIPVHWMVLLYAVSQSSQAQSDVSGMRLMTYVLCVTVLYALLWFFIFPTNYARKHNIRDTSSYLHRLYEGASDKIAEQSYAEARDILYRMQNIVRNDPEVENLLLSVQRRQELQTDSKGEQGERGNEGDVDAHILEAEKYLTLSDFASAYYYAQLAIRATDPPLPLALQRADEALQGLRNFSSPLSDEVQRNFYEEKQRGVEIFLEGAVDPEQYVHAFFIFEDLLESHPNDADVVQYHRISQQALEEISFFTEDAERARIAPGSSHIVFLNGKQGSLRQLIAINRVTFFDGAEYLFDIEVMTLDTEKGLQEHFHAAYAKAGAGYLNFRAIDTERRFQDIEVFEGNPPDYFIPLSIPLLDVVLSSDPNWRRGENIVSLWKFSKYMESVDLQTSNDIKNEIVLRCMRIALLIIGSFFFIGVALRNRYKEGRAIWLLSPLLFFVFSFLFFLVEYGLSLIISYMLHSVRFLTLVAVMGGMFTCVFTGVAIYAVWGMRKLETTTQ